MTIKKIKLQYVIPALLLVDLVIWLVSPENLVNSIIGNIAMIGAILGYNTKNK
ncbi:hypothetical protein U0X36_30095 [Bacillus thuringiensis]|nr:hypothetical protein [Bacillus thuringiensis]MDZ3957029.1 hypothetical protein [Bacillus thuringiensis]